MNPVDRLTRREQLVLAMLLFLFIVGWTVKVWRESAPPDPARAVSEG